MFRVDKNILLKKLRCLIDMSDSVHSLQYKHRNVDSGIIIENQFCPIGEKFFKPFYKQWSASILSFLYYFYRLCTLRHTYWQEDSVATVYRLHEQLE